MYNADDVKPKLVKILVDRILEVDDDCNTGDEEALGVIAQGIQSLAMMGFFSKPLASYKDPYNK